MSEAALFAPTAIEAVLAEGRGRQRRAWLAGLAVAVGLMLVFTASGLFDLNRYRGALSTLLTLASDALPPDFSRWRSWGKPLADTMAMSVAGTVLALAAALPLGALAARTLAPSWIGGPVRLLLNTLRSIPSLIWGVLFVAAVGFGPLPGVFALACHSTGMLGKFAAEMFEHVDRAPADALKSHGVSPLGVFRFAIWPQVLPRLTDVILYRWEHNVRAAVTLGVVGAGGLGLEIVTAFHLFEYREASALILVMLALVTLINFLGSELRRRFLSR